MENSNIVKIQQTQDRKAVVSEFLAKGGDKIIMEVLSEYVAQTNNAMLNASEEDLKPLASRVKYSSTFAVTLIESLKRLISVDK